MHVATEDLGAICSSRLPKKSLPQKIIVAGYVHEFADVCVDCSNNYLFLFSNDFMLLIALFFILFGWHSHWPIYSNISLRSRSARASAVQY